MGQEKCGAGGVRDRRSAEGRAYGGRLITPLVLHQHWCYRACCRPPRRRAGRFDREISLGIPTEAARVKILQVRSPSLPGHPD